MVNKEEKKLAKYRIENSELHKKNLGKHTLTDRLTYTDQITSGYAISVYHYTSPEGLMGILKNREIFFTDAQYLNDYRERMSINDELKRFWEENRGEYDKDFYQLFKGIYIDSYEDNKFPYIDENTSEELYRFFIMSASMNNDSLSMWKYYAKDDTYNGYNIDLFIPALDDEWIDRETGVAVEVGVVIYDSNQKQSKIHTIMEKLYDEWCKYKVSDLMNQKMIKEYTSWISYASLFFKNSCFSTEEEMRFVAAVPKAKLNEINYELENGTRKPMYDFRVSNGVIIPFIRMPLFGWNNSENWISNRIGVGPCMNFDLKKEGILQLIESLDYKFHKIDVVKSEIPLRY